MQRMDKNKKNQSPKKTSPKRLTTQRKGAQEGHQIDQSALTLRDKLNYHRMIANESCHNSI